MGGMVHAISSNLQRRSTTSANLLAFIALTSMPQTVEITHCPDDSMLFFMGR